MANFVFRRRPLGIDTVMTKPNGAQPLPADTVAFAQRIFDAARAGDDECVQPELSSFGSTQLTPPHKGRWARPSEPACPPT